MEQSTYKAERRTIYLGDIHLEVAMLPSGDYCLSQAQVAEVINKRRNSMFSFYRSKYFNSLFDNGFECSFFEEKLYVKGTNKSIIPVPVNVACLYWQKWATSGNDKAKALIIALLKHSIQELSDREFGINRSDEARNQALREDLSSDPKDYLESLEQKAGDFLKFPSQEIPTERELQLKIKLAELELEKIKSLGQPYDPHKIRKLGTFCPEVLIYLKDKLKLQTWSEAESFLEKVELGKDSGKWVRVKISGDMSIMPWHSFGELQQICSQIKAQQN